MNGTWQMLRKCAGELPTIPVSDQDPTRILHDDLWSRRVRGVELVSIEVITRQGRA